MPVEYIFTGDGIHQITKRKVVFGFLIQVVKDLCHLIVIIIPVFVRHSVGTTPFKDVAFPVLPEKQSHSFESINLFLLDLCLSLYSLLSLLHRYCGTTFTKIK